MLLTLYIENVAVIEKCSIDFEGGLNVLTGETGAGKSIIIDAIHAIMGQRTSREIIRTGADSAFVSAVFDEINDEVASKLRELGFEPEEELMIQRTLSASGKSSCKINGRPATVSMLRELAPGLINIHGQHESYALFSPSARLSEIDLLSFQTQELFDADVQPGEAEALEGERRYLMNFEKLSDLLHRAHELLSGEDVSGCELVDMAANAMQSAASYSEEYEQVSNDLTDVYYNLRDCAESISDALDSLESDPERLEEIEERLDLLSRLERKYNCSADELPALAERMQSRLE